MNRLKTTVTALAITTGVSLITVAAVQAQQAAPAAQQQAAAQQENNAPSVNGIPGQDIDEGKSFAAIKLDDLKPEQAYTGAGAIAAVLVTSLALACLFVVLAVVLSKPRQSRPQAKRAHRGVHHQTSGTRIWHRRIDEVVDRFHAGDISRDQAFAQLASLARAYASGMADDTMETRTLSDLNRTM